VVVRPAIAVAIMHRMRRATAALSGDLLHAAQDKRKYGYDNARGFQISCGHQYCLRVREVKSISRHVLALKLSLAVSDDPSPQRGEIVTITLPRFSGPSATSGIPTARSRGPTMDYHRSPTFRMSCRAIELAGVVPSERYITRMTFLPA
jgi:hypothetical protein